MRRGRGLLLEKHLGKAAARPAPLGDGPFSKWSGEGAQAQLEMNSTGKHLHPSRQRVRVDMPGGHPSKMPNFGLMSPDVF